MFRIKGLIFVAVVAALSFAVSLISPDAWLEESIEYQASILNEALVEIDDFDFDLVGLRMSWSRMQVTNPNNTMFNTFETGETEFDLLFWPVLWERVLIEDIKLTGFKMNTERETDGAFEIPLNEDGEPEEPGFLTEVTRQVSGEIRKNAQMQISDVRDDLNVDSLMAIVDVRSLTKMDSLQTNLNQKYTTWEQTLSTNPIEQRADSIEATLTAIKVPEMKDPQQVIRALEQVNKVNEQVKKLKTQADSLKKAFESDFSTSNNALGSIDNWIQEDIQRAVNVARLPDLNAQNIGTALFGGNLLGNFSSYLEYIALARKYGNRFTGADETEEIPRYEGIDYSFSDKYDWPSFWIQNIELSGETGSGLALAGQVTNISSDQDKTGAPILIDLSGQNSVGVRLSVNGELDYRGDRPTESVEVVYSGFSLRNSRISPSELLKYDLTSGTGELRAKLDIVDRRIDSEIRYTASNIAFDFASAGAPKNRIEGLIRDAIGGTDNVNATALIDNQQGPLRVRVRSNIDDLFLNTLRSTVTQQVDDAKRKIRSEVESQVTEKRQEVEQLVDEKEAQIRKEYEALQAKVNEQLQKAEAKKKELEEKKKELEKGLLDGVRNRVGF